MDDASGNALLQSQTHQSRAPVTSGMWSARRVWGCSKARSPSLDTRALLVSSPHKAPSWPLADQFMIETTQWENTLQHPRHFCRAWVRLHSDAYPREHGYCPL